MLPGVAIDMLRTERGEARVGAAGSRVDVLVIPADEERPSPKKL